MSGADNNKKGGNDQNQKTNGQANKNRGGRNNTNNRNRNNAENSRGAGSSSRARPRLQPVHNHKVDMKKYEKMIGAAHANFADIDLGGGDVDDCTICCKTADLFGIGPCRHPVCMECAIRIRILGDQKSCPVCRGEINTLFLTYASSGLSKVLLEFPLLRHKDEERFAIRFESKSASRRYDKYLAHVCKICKTEDGERLEFPTFVALRQHMANGHQLSYCHICTENLNLFSRERKTYTRESLQRHIKCGDADDKSQKGHPSCLFCDSRFFDQDAQYRHLRKEHFFCQFCEADGTMTNVFFGKHDELVNHYKEKHFLCEVEECKQMGIAFANQFDLNLHRSREHCKKMQLDFNYSDRQLVGASRSRRGEQQQQAPVLSGRFERVSVIPRAEPEPAPVRPQVEYVVVPSAQSRQPLRYGRMPNYTPQAQDFPTLGGAPAEPAQPSAPPPSASDFPRLKKTAKPQQPPSKKQQAKQQASREEQFPTLGGSRSAPQAQAQTDWAKHSDRFEMIDDDERLASRASSSAAAAVAQQARPQTRPASAHAQQLARPKPTPPSVPSQPVEDYPSLPMPAGKMKATVSGKWAQVAKGKSAITGVMMPKRQVKAPLPVPDLWPDQKPKPTPASEYKPPEEVWEEVPARRLTEQELRSQQRKAEKTAKKLAKKAEKQAKELEMRAPDEDLEMQAVLMNDAIASSPSRGENSSDSNRSSISNKSKGEEKTNNKKKTVDTLEYPASISGAVAKRVESPTGIVNGATTVNNNGDKNKENQYIKKSSDFPSLNTSSVPSKNNKSSAKKDESSVNVQNGDESAANSGGGLGSWLSSVSSMISGLSLSNVLGDSVSSGPLSAMQTTAANPSAPTEVNKNQKAMLSAPPGLSSIPSQSPPNSDVTTPSSTILSSAPPGFEGVTLAPPPGLEVPSSQLSFSMAPMLSAADTQRVPVKTQSAADGWQQASTKK